MTYSRRRFVRSVGALGVLSLPALAWEQSSVGPGSVTTAPASTTAVTASPVPQWPVAPPAGAVTEAYPTQDAALAHEIVAVSHTNLARVRELVTQHPALAKAAWDWGFGDWETALGAASHTGQRAIAELLLENGAPPTIFSATMLGQLEIVKAFVAADPKAPKMRGPHGIPLLVHARLGGPPTAAVADYIEKLGGGEPLAEEPLTAEDRSSLAGRYSFGTGPRDAFVVEARPDRLGFTRLGATQRFLFHVGDLQFHPPGANAVRIKFEHSENKVTALSIWDPDLVVRARRDS